MPTWRDFQLYFANLTNGIQQNSMAFIPTKKKVFVSKLYNGQVVAGES